MYGQTGFATKQDYDRERYRRQKQEREKHKPAHPITKLTNEEKAYIAGLIDGEGAIYCANKSDKTCHATISIFMTHEGVLRWLTDKTGAQKVMTIKPRNNGKFKSIPKTQYLYRTCGKTAKMLCEAILPYLKVKSNHARVVCAFPVDARIAPGTKIAKSETNKIRMRLAEQLTALNENRYKRNHAG